MDKALVQQIRERAHRCCEYCQLPQDYSNVAFEIDHVIAQKHGGATVAGNLALSCFRCNSFKGTDLASLDPLTRKLTPLFNPRRHKWGRHFRWDGRILEGRTPIGRVTIALLNINEPFRVTLRADLIEAGVFPPSI
ncbi:MAG: HNH endonuclease [Gemmataceae bacterium]